MLDRSQWHQAWLLVAPSALAVHACIARIDELNKALEKCSEKARLSKAPATASAGKSKSAAVAVKAPAPKAAAKKAPVSKPAPKSAAPARKTARVTNTETVAKPS